MNAEEHSYELIMMAMIYTVSRTQFSRVQNTVYTPIQEIINMERLGLIIMRQ